MKINSKQIITVISVLLAGVLASLILVYVTGQNFEKSVHERLSQFNESQGYQGQLQAYDKLNEDYQSWALILNLNGKAKAEYENAKYEMKTKFEKRFLYLSSVITDQKNKIAEESEDIQSNEKSAMESNIKQQADSFKEEVKINNAFTEEEKARFIYTLDSKAS